MPLDPRVLRLQTPDDCETFAANALARNLPDLALQARQRAVELRAASEGPNSDAERECLQAVFAYEETLYIKHGKRVKAAHTWKAFKSKGILKAVDNLVSLDRPTVGYEALQKAGLQEFAFEAVVLKYPKLFSKQAIEQSARRLAEWTRAGAKAPDS
jgi:hypothetical protein